MEIRVCRICRNPFCVYIRDKEQRILGMRCLRCNNIGLIEDFPLVNMKPIQKEDKK